MKTTQHEQWHKLVEDNIALVKYIIRKEFKFSRKSDITLEEAINEGFLKLCEVAKKYYESGDTRKFSTYAGRSIRNCIYKMFRAENTAKRDISKVNKQADMTNLGLVRKYDNVYHHYDNEDHCKHILNKAPLDNLTKDILYLFYWQDLSYKEIADKLNVELIRVHYKLQQAKIILKETYKSTPTI